ncbi:MAG: hypothetical protein ACRDIB_19100, partial [Ardenticatenaceae bacterium]
MEREKFQGRPDMVSEAGCHGRRAWHPAVVTRADPKLDPQTVMGSAEIIEAAHANPGGGQGVELLGQTAGAAMEPHQPLAKGSIEPFDVSGVDEAALLRALEQHADRLLSPLHQAALNGQAIGGALFDHL